MDHEVSLERSTTGEVRTNRGISNVVAYYPGLAYFECDPPGPTLALRQRLCPGRYELLQLGLFLITTICG